MKRCSRLLFLLGLFILPMLSMAQNLSVDGTVFSSTGTPIAYTDVWLEYPAPSGGGYLVDSTFTDSSGYFNFGTVVANTQGAALVYATCGFNNSVYDTLFFNPGNTSFTTTLTCGTVSSGPCVAAFTATPQPTPLDPYGYWIQMQYGNNDPNANYYYDFGNGNTGNTGGGLYQSYPGPGTYTICLTVTAGSCQDILCQTITIPAANPCIASFSYWNSGASFTFLADSSNFSPTATYSWSYGNGNTGSGLYGTQTYSQPGPQTVCLVVSDPTTNCIDTVCQTIIVPQTCSATASITSQVGDTVQFLAQLTSGTGTFSYLWDFGDGVTSIAANPTHVYPGPGWYNACVTVSNNTGCAVTQCVQVLIQGSPCTANFWANNWQGSTYLSADTSWYDPSTVYQWNLGDGTTATGVWVQHTYAVADSYYVCLYVSNPVTGCSDSTCQWIYSPGPNGTCTASFGANNAPGTLDVSFTPISSGGTIDSVDWSFGDGTFGVGPTPTHTYPNSGYYNVCITIYYTSGCVATACQNVYVSNATGGCDSDFIISQTSANDFYFLAVDSLLLWQDYQWTFGDGSPIVNGPYSNHTYAAPGTYTVCLVVMDTSNNCIDSTCKTVTVTGNPVNCAADFSYQVAAGGQVFFVNQSTGVTPNSFFEWSFGDGTTSNAINAVHTYPGPGTYNTCLYIQTAGCSDTFCLPVTISNPATCGAGFTYAATSVANTFAFTDSSVSSTGGVTYVWDFGDSTTSTLQNPTHTYNTPGPWFACLTITDSSGCSDTYCTVVQPVNIPGTYFVSGVIVTDSLLGTQSLVYLIEHDAVANTLTAVDSQYASFGYYQFSNVDPGSYLVKAGLTPNAPLYSSNLPTYHGDVLTWDLAISTVVTNADVWNLPITLVAGNNPGGPAFIGGLISQGANKDGDPLEGISVMLMTIGEDPVTHTMTNVDGEYSFTNLAYGTYIVHVEIPGKVAEDWTVTLDANNPTFTLGDFDVHTTYIDAIGTTSISIGLDPSSVKVYPNPSSSLINIALDLEANGARIDLVNSLGAVIETIETNNGNVTEQMNLSDLANGVYLIQVTTDNGSLTHRVIRR